VSQGESTITVTTTDGGHLATCEVTVIISVDSITLNKTALTLERGETEQLTASIIPEDASDKSVQWMSINESVATVSADGIVTAVSQGVSTITVTTTDGGHLATCEVTVVPAGSVATEDLWQATNTLKVYPSPTSGVVTLDGIAKGTVVEVYNFTGALVLRTYGSSIDLSRYPTGVYLIKADGKTARMVKV
jgi:uncharacterized protein YjdB